MRFIIIKWWSFFSRLQPHNDIGPPFAHFHSPCAMHFTHGGAIARHATHSIERQLSTPAGAVMLSHAPTANRAVRKAWLRFQAFILTGAVVTYALKGYDDTIGLLRSLPRTFRTVLWAIQAGLSYKRFMTLHLDHDSDEYVVALSQLHEYWATSLLQVCRSNGGVYVKAGQFAAAFGAVPREYRMLLANLEDKVTPKPFQAIKRVLLAELGPNYEQHFSQFEEHATAAASLAQVHRAWLSGGQEVAVKLQYPGLASAVTADLSTMKLLSWVAGLFFPDYSLGWLYDELERKLEVELDFRNELQNALKMRSILNFSNNHKVSLPHMYEDLCTNRIIVMEWIQGTKITDKDSLSRQGINPRAVGLALVKLFAELTFIHGYVHGDPHPGNLMVRAKGKRSLFNWLFRGSKQPFEIVLLDHGTYLTVDPVLREMFCQLWCSFVMQDKEMQQRVCTQLAGERGGTVLPVLLTHQAKSRSEERALQKSVGINRFSDMTVLLASASKDLVDLLRINTVIRASSNVLGITMDERKRIYAWYSRKGLPSLSEFAPHIHEHFNSWVYRAKLMCLLAGWSSYIWTKALLVRTWDMVLSVFGEAVFD